VSEEMSGLRPGFRLCLSSPIKQTTRQAALALVAGALLQAGAARAETETSATTEAACDAKRPIPSFNRWQEDWGALAKPCVPRKPLDRLKYIALSSYLAWADRSQIAG